ncbi:MAG: hypothetical protein WA210_20850 [Burkholderiaceae bacterium]
MSWPLGILACGVAVMALPCLAQGRAAPRAPDLPRQEPKVEFIVLEDDGARIEELRVRGHTQRIVVTPKRGTSVAYEVIMGDGSNSQAAGPNASRGAVGQRVWHVLSF